MKIVRRSLDLNFPRWLIALIGIQFAGYAMLWWLLHLPNTAPAVTAGWFTPGSSYADWTARQSLLQWLALRPQLQGLLGLVTFGIISTAYLLTVLLVPRHVISFRTASLLAITSIFALPLLALPRLLSSDVYSYALFGRIPLLYGGNPFVNPPSQFPHDPLLPAVAWKTTASVYGPTWIILSLPITGLAQLLGGSPGVYALLYKLVGFLSHLGSIMLIMQLLSRLRPQLAGWGTILYAWHPLVLLEFVGSGHNDSFMVLLVLTALWYAVQQRSLLALTFLVLAGLVKLVAMLLVPLYVLYLVRSALPLQRFLRLLYYTSIALGISVVLYAPFWVGPATLQILVTAPPLTIIHNGPASWVVAKLEQRPCPSLNVLSAGDTQEQSGAGGMTRCPEAWRRLVRQVSILTFVLAYSGLVFWPVRSIERFIDRSAWILLAYTLLGAIHFEPWYGTWLIALAPLMQRVRPLLLVWGCTLLLFYATLDIKGRVALAFAPIIALGIVEVCRIILRQRKQPDYQ